MCFCLIEMHNIPSANAPSGQTKSANATKIGVRKAIVFYWPKATHIWVLLFFSWLFGICGGFFGRKGWRRKLGKEGSE